MEEATRARTVRDVIPQSKLALYADYEYNEAREMSYASSVSDISFYYPCLYKKGSTKEAWMLPEVEQIFIWLTYSKEINFTRNMEELHCDDEFGDCSELLCVEFHEFKPIFFENFERTPGKPRFKETNILTDDDYNMVSYYLWSHTLTIDCFDDMILKMNIKSGTRHGPFNSLLVRFSLLFR